MIRINNFEYNEKGLREIMNPDKPGSTSNSEASKQLSDLLNASIKMKKEKSGIPTSEPQPEKNTQTLSELSAFYNEVTAKLLGTIKGQDNAVMKFVQGCFQGDLIESGKNTGPMANFFFLGPPGTGKTLLAETAAEVMNLPYKFFNMNEYVRPDACDELVGTPSIFGNAKEGSLTSFVRKNPRSIVIFDEIEKAHMSTIRIFLQMLNSGYMRDVKNDTNVSFEETIVIFTSNCGKKLYDDVTVNLTKLPESVVISSIKDELPPEICSRIASGNMIMFNHLSIHCLADMVVSKFNSFADKMESTYGCKVTYPKELPLLFMFSKGGDLDARVVARKSSAFLEDEVHEIARQIENSNQSLDALKSISFDVDWDGCSDEIKKLFFNNSKSEIIVMADDDVVDLFRVDENKYTIHTPKSVEEATEIIKRDISAVFIAPCYGEKGNNEKILSVSDYKSIGIDFFQSIARTESGIPIYILDTESDFSDVDNNTFVQEGAYDVIDVDMAHKDQFSKIFTNIMDVLYMESEGTNFTSKGWVIDYDTVQDDIDDNGLINVTFYNISKKKAVDASNRGAFVSDAERPVVKFDDIIGATEAKEELKYFVQYLTNPRQFLANGGRPPKGVLLYGPPGTGKTMLAKAMAGECDVNFIEVSAANFLDKYVGGSEENVRKIFAMARKYAPAIIFIDEIDAIGKKRTGSEFNSTTETVLNVLLTEMDGFSGSNKRKPVFVLAATNYGVGEGEDGIADLDPALIRRFDNKINVNLPKEEDRLKYLRMMVSKREFTGISDDTLKNIAERTVGQSLAILSNILDLAYRNAQKEGREVSDSDLLKAQEDYHYGELRESSPEYYKSVAYHELGHAYVSYLGGDCPSYITIEARSNFGGYMQHGSKENVNSHSYKDLIWKIRTSLAGRAAEYVFENPEDGNNTGASSDLEHATNVAFHIVLSFGMLENQLVTLKRDEVLKSSLAEKYVAQVNEILVREFQETIKIIENGRADIETLAEELLKENHMTGAQFEEIMKKMGK